MKETDRQTDRHLFVRCRFREDEEGNKAARDVRRDHGRRCRQMSVVSVDTDHESAMIST